MEDVTGLSLRFSELRTWLVRVDPPASVRRPERFGPLESHRFGLLTGPLDVTGFMWIRERILTGLSQYPVFKVQAQRGDTLLARSPAVNQLLPPISQVVSRCPDRPMKNAPNLWLEASARRWLGRHMRPQFAYPIILFAQS